MLLQTASVEDKTTTWGAQSTAHLRVHPAPILSQNGISYTIPTLENPSPDQAAVLAANTECQEAIEGK